MKFLYVYHGEKYRSEALGSAKSLLLQHSSADITVICPAGQELALEHVKHINIEATSNNNGFRYKIFGICKFIEDEFIYLDTDTTIINKPIGLFEANNLAGLAGVPEPLLCSFNAIQSLVRPNTWKQSTLPEINTGVISINRRLLPKDFLEQWIRFHDQLISINCKFTNGSVPDQPSLLAAIIHNKITPLYLGSSYNFRACYPQILYEPIVVSHSHSEIGAAFTNSSPIDEREIVITTPWGLKIRRTGWLNRTLFALRRAINNFRFAPVKTP